MGREVGIDLRDCWS